jgi:hypothetical protein
MVSEGFLFQAVLGGFAAHLQFPSLEVKIPTLSPKNGEKGGATGDKGGARSRSLRR